MIHAHAFLDEVKRRRRHTRGCGGRLQKEVEDNVIWESQIVITRKSHPEFVPLSSSKE